MPLNLQDPQIRGALIGSLVGAGGLSALGYATGDPGKRKRRMLMAGMLGAGLGGGAGWWMNQRLNPGAGSAKGGEGPPVGPGGVQVKPPPQSTQPPGAVRGGLRPVPTTPAPAPAPAPTPTAGASLPWSSSLLGPTAIGGYLGAGVGAGFGQTATWQSTPKPGFRPGPPGASITGGTLVRRPPRLRPGLTLPIGAILGGLAGAGLGREATR